MPVPPSSDQGSDAVVLRPLAVTRRGYLVGGLFVAAIGVFLVVVGFSSGTVWLLAVMGVLLVAYGVVAAVRGQTVCVMLTKDAAVVHGLLVTTTVPRPSITRATNKPSLEWTDSGGRERSTRITALALGNRAGTAAAVLQHVDEDYERLKAWIRAR